jgi:5-methylthioadenosine/S-adenosylhomocysteine deaminase
MHLCESVRDDEIARNRYGKDAVDWLDSLELLADNFVAVHCVKLRPAAIEVFSSRRVNVSFNPVSNMFVGNGIAPIAALRGSGVRVTLGTDGAGVNNNDLLETMKVAALLVRVATEDPDTIRAGDVVRMATIEGARALGLGDEIGSLEAGKRADLILFDLRNSRSSPHHDPLDSLVFSTNTQAVDSVMVDGRLLVADGQLVDRDERELVATAQEQATTVARRNGLA